MKHPGRVDDVERMRVQAGLTKIGLDEPHALHSIPARGICTELERGPGEVDANDSPIPAGKVQTHLACAAANLDDPRVGRDRAVQQPRYRTSLTASTERGQILV